MTDRFTALEGKVSTRFSEILSGVPGDALLCPSALALTAVNILRDRVLWRVLFSDCDHLFWASVFLSIMRNYFLL